MPILFQHCVPVFVEHDFDLKFRRYLRKKYLPLLAVKGEATEYGEQFRADGYVTVTPATLVGIERYLGSGLVPGIGPSPDKMLLGQKVEASSLRVTASNDGYLIKGDVKVNGKQIRQSSIPANRLTKSARTSLQDSR